MSDDKKRADVPPNVLATASKQIAALQELVADLAAELQCYGISMGARNSGALGIDGFRFPANSSRGMWESVRAAVLAKLRAE